MKKSIMMSAVSLVFAMFTWNAAANANGFAVLGKSLKGVTSPGIIKVHTAQRAHDTLHNRGYYRVVYQSQRDGYDGKPVFRFRACRNGKRYRVAVNWYGDIVRRKWAGFCIRRY